MGLFSITATFPNEAPTLERILETARHLSTIEVEMVLSTTTDVFEGIPPEVLEEARAFARRLTNNLYQTGEQSPDSPQQTLQESTSAKFFLSDFPEQQLLLSRWSAERKVMFFYSVGDAPPLRLLLQRTLQQLGGEMIAPVPPAEFPLTRAGAKAYQARELSERRKLGMLSLLFALGLLILLSSICGGLGYLAWQRLTA